MGQEWRGNHYRTIAPIDDAAIRASAQMGLVFDGSIRASRAKPVTDLIRERQTRKTEWWKYAIDTNEARLLTAAELLERQSIQKSSLTDNDVYLTKRSPDGKAKPTSGDYSGPRILSTTAGLLLIKIRAVRRGRWFPLQMSLFRTFDGAIPEKRSTLRKRRIEWPGSLRFQLLVGPSHM